MLYLAQLYKELEGLQLLFPDQLLCRGIHGRVANAPGRTQRRSHQEFWLMQ
jgi:hypothetical protein